MPYFTSSEEWQRQSALLLQARPNTVCLLHLPTALHHSTNTSDQTRITTKYHIPSADSLSPKPSAPSDATADPSKPAQPIAQLELKTFDPVSGTTLKYRTDKAAEVGRLIAAMGSLGREMAALPEVKGDVVMADATQEVEAEAPVQAQQTQQQSGAGKKKKKGKK